MISPLAREFAALVSPEIEDEQIDLLTSSLTIAKLEYPELDVTAYRERVTAIAEHVKARVSRTDDSLETLGIINEVLFGDEGFRGNVSDYYDPKNSFFNEVLDRKLGIPITLSVLYMEVARRAGIPVFGVGMPGHFLLKFYEVDGRELFLDAYNSGRLLSPEDCQEKLTEIYNGQIPLDAKFLTPVGKRQILTRMLNNLRSIYMTNRLLKKALAVIDLILVIYPRSADDVKQRAMLRYQLGHLHGAADELDEYVKMAPDASDADEMKQTAMAIRRTIALMN
jgi:regulator of sirC expression with transglutaminase-like and TPR domain